MSKPIPEEFGTPTNRNQGSIHRAAFWMGFDGLKPLWLELNGSEAHKAWKLGKSLSPNK